jgi:pimeloyl-ACP methyl ester carboxylesterase
MLLPPPPAAAEFVDTGTGPLTVLLLHSSMSSKAQWRGLVDTLRCAGRVIAPDLLGYGSAPMPAEAADFTLDDEVQRLLSLLHALDVQGPLHMVGHSYGGAVALRLALALGRRVRGLTLYEPTAFHAVPTEHERHLQAVRDVAAALRRAEGHGMAAEAAAVARFIDFWNEPGAFAALPPARQAAFIALAPKVRLDFQALCDPLLVGGDYRRLQAPVHLVGGRHSPGCARAVLAALSAQLPHSELVTLSAGHMAPVTHPALVNPELLAAIGAHSRRRVTDWIGDLVAA